MVRYIEVIPHKGIISNGRLIALGTERSELTNLTDSFDGEVRFDFDSAGRLEAIEFLYGYDGLIQPLIYGKKAFKLDADELVSLLIEQNCGRVVEDNGYAYSFIETDVGIYREMRPCDVEEMIAEAAKLGNPMSAEDIAAELKNAGHWCTLLIGRERYYADFYKI